MIPRLNKVNHGDRKIRIADFALPGRIHRQHIACQLVFTGALTLIIFIASVWAWAFTSVDDTYISLGAATALVLTGALSPDEMFASLGDDTIWLLVAAFVIAVGVSASGLTGRLAAWLVPHWGWQSVFVFGGVVPMVLSLLMAVLMPESLTYLVHRQGSQARIRRIVERCAPGSTSEDTVFVLPAQSRVESHERPVQIVLNRHYRAGSLMLWSIYFLHLFLVYLLGSWLPTMLKDAGMDLQQAAIVSAMFQLGGPLGSILLGWLMDRHEAHHVLAGAYLLGGAALVLLGYVGGHYALMCAVAFVIGAGLNGGGTGMNALSSHFFPLPARATGNGWMHGLGRIGAVISAFAGAWMLNAGWSLAAVTAALAVPAVLIAVLLAMKYLHYRGEGRPAG